MGLEAADQAFEQSIAGNQDSQSAAPEPISLEQGQAEQKAPEFIDLDSLDKPIRFQGKDWTATELREAYMLKSDYSRKTQALAEERKRMGDEYKYDVALKHDLQTLIARPELVNEFLQKYPEQFHFIKNLFANNQTQQSPQQNVLSPQVDSRISKVEQFMQQQEKSVQEAQVKASEAAIDSLFTKMQAKYPDAHEGLVITQAEHLIAQGIKLSDENGIPKAEVYEKIWKAVNESEKKRFEDRYKKQVNEQKQANVKGKDVPVGGSTPGQAPVKRNLKEATEAALAHFESLRP